jgi:hypothetical protein
MITSAILGFILGIIFTITVATINRKSVSPSEDLLRERNAIGRRQADALESLVAIAKDDQRNEPLYPSAK